MGHVFRLLISLTMASSATADECSTLADRLRSATRAMPELPSGLSKLQKAVRNLSQSAEPRTLEVVEGKGHLKIGYLYREDIGFSKAVVSAVREESMREIRFGEMSGPPTVAMVSHLLRIAPSERPIRLSGIVNPMQLIRRLEKHGKPGELERFKTSLHEIGALDGCRRILNVSKLEDCGWLSFEIDTARSRVPRWEPDRHKQNEIDFLEFI